jgi:hypothetical protein
MSTTSSKRRTLKNLIENEDETVVHTFDKVFKMELTISSIHRMIDYLIFKRKEEDANGLRPKTTSIGFK